MSDTFSELMVMPSKCFKCGADLIINGNDKWGDGEANRYYYTCPNCGFDYKVCEPQEEDKKNYPYWGDD